MNKIALLIACAACCCSAADSSRLVEKNPQVAERQGKEQVIANAHFDANDLLPLVKALQSQQNVAENLKKLVEKKELLSKQKFQVVVVFTEQYVKQQEQKVSQENLDRIEEQRKSVVSKFDELIRLIGLVEKYNETDLFTEKVNDLFLFLKPVSLQNKKNGAVSRGAQEVDTNLDKKRIP